MNPRHLILGLALVGTAILAFLPTEEPEDQIVAPVRRVKAPATPASGNPAPDKPTPPSASEAVGRPAFAVDAETDLFPSQSFRPPPPPPPKFVPPPPPPPMAPPLPYGFIGAWTEQGVETVFLSQGDRVLPVRKGTSLTGGWRLDDVQPGSLLFTYEPLNQQKTLRIAP